MSKEKINFRLSLYFENYFVISSSAFCNCTSFSCDKTIVIESSGNTWKTKEPAIMYFFKDKWFNVIAQLKKDGIYFYCNIATPYIIEDQMIKYIDYDLDLRIFPSGDFKILDCLEYNYHKRVMYYSEDLDKVIRLSLDELISLYKNKSQIFEKENILKYYEQYIKLKEEGMKYNN